MSLRVVVLVSGRGSNLQAIVKQQGDYEVVAVISNKADALALEFAKHHDIATAVIDNKDHVSRALFDKKLVEVIDYFNPDLIVLAGFMRILTSAFVEHYHKRLINIHPSLLPKYKGLNTHQQALDSGDEYHGCTVHFVTSDLDAGPIIKQNRVAIEANDDVDTLAHRVLTQEHQLYPQVIQWFAQKKIHYHNNRVELDV